LRRKGAACHRAQDKEFQVKTKSGLSISKTKDGFWKIEDATGKEIGEIERKRQGHVVFVVLKEAKLSEDARVDIVDYIEKHCS
jgi:hypothetical protein